MFIMKNHVDLLQKISFVKEMINQFESGLEQIGDGHQEAYKFQSKITELKELLSKYEAIRDRSIKLINELKPLAFKIGKLRYIDGLSYKDIAKKLSKSYQYVRCVASKANKREEEFFASIATN